MSEQFEKCTKYLNDMGRFIFEWCKGKGFWDMGIENRNKGEMIALMHSELSEALEALRHGNPQDEHCPEFGNLEIELADCVIRILDFSYAFNLDIGAAMAAKMKYNATRPSKHGKNF